MGAVANCQTLSLAQNVIGDNGMKAFSSALAGGALANCHTLSLRDNSIGDQGMIKFSKALATGAMASLKKLAVINYGPLEVNHPKLKAACQKRGITLR